MVEEMSGISQCVLRIRIARACDVVRHDGAYHSPVTQGILDVGDPWS